MTSLQGAGLGAELLGRLSQASQTRISGDGAKNSGLSNCSQKGLKKVAMTEHLSWARWANSAIPGSLVLRATSRLRESMTHACWWLRASKDPTKPIKRGWSPGAEHWESRSCRCDMIPWGKIKGERRKGASELHNCIRVSAKPLSQCRTLSQDGHLQNAKL